MDARDFEDTVLDVDDWHRQAPAYDDAPRPEDHLLACLEYVARGFGKPFSRASVMSGLPLGGDILTVDLLPRAAERVGLNARLVRRKVRQVPAIVAPFIVLLDSGDACVVVAKRAGGKQLTVVFPSYSNDARSVKTADLEAEATGYLFYLTPELRSGDLLRPRGSQVDQDKHWFWPAVRRFWPSWVQIVIAALVINLLGLALPLFVMNVYDRVIPNLAIPTLWALAAGVVIALMFDFLLKQLRAHILDRTGRRVDMKVAASLFEHAMAVSMAERSGPAGAIANQIREFESVRDFFTSSSIVAITDFLFIGVFILVLLAIVGPIAYVPLLAVPVVLIATLLIQIPLSRAVRSTQVQASQRHSILVEGLVGTETIKAVSGEGVMQRRWEDAIAATARANSKVKFWSSSAVMFTASVQQAVSVIIIVWGVFLVSDSVITIGGLIAANILAGRVLAPLGNIAMTLARAQQAFSAMRDLNVFMRLKTDRNNEIAHGRTVEHGKVEFKDVCFSYPGSQTEVLRDVSFKIYPGERVGLIGRVGSGKTTIGKLLAGLYSPQRGTVLMDDIDARGFEAADLREGVGFVSQEPELFMGTLRENLTLGRPTATEHEIAAAMRVAGADEIAAAHPLGLGMPIGERGSGLSGGQRQAVALARMLIRMPRVLFLDEPSSAMDTVTEAALIEHLEAESYRGQTFLICTHRSSFLKLVDRLLVVEGGRIVADGPKDDVLRALEMSAAGRDDPYSDGGPGR